MDIHRLGAVCFTLLLCSVTGAIAQDTAKQANPVTMTQMTSDVQVAADGSSVQTLHVEIRASNDAAALQVSQASFPFDIQSQEIAVVEAHTLKADGKTLPVDVSAIYDQAPPGQQMSMVTGLRAKLIVFPQFTAGDTAVYTVKLTTKHPNFEGRFVYGELFARTSAYSDVRVTITAPKNFPLYVESHDVDASKREDAANVIYSWHYSAPKPDAEETPTLSPLEHMPRFFASSFKDYAELGRAYAALAEPKRVVTPKIAALADQIAKGESDPKIQAQKLYEWVSAHIRYVGIELGTGSFVPHDVDAIVDNGYGDCKDHDILLQALLKAKGIDAQSILINGGNSYAMTDVPTFTTLNHVITFVPQFDLYLDSSAAVAPFGILPMQEYGKPMVVASATAARLGKMPVLPAGLAKITVKTATVLDKDGGLTGTTTTTATGPYTITLRLIGLGIQALGPSAATKLLTATGYKDPTGTLTLDSPLGFAPVFTVTGTYAASGWSDMLSGKSSFFLPGGMRLFSLTGDGIMGPFNPGKMKPDEPTPCFSAEATEDLSLRAPPGFQFSEVPKDLKVQTPNLLFVAHWSLDGNTLSVHRDFSSTIGQPFCSGAIRTQTAAALKQISDSYDTNISFRQQSGDASDPKAKAADDADASALKHFDAGEFDLAVADYNREIAITPDNGAAYLNRGLTQVKAGHEAEAIIDFNKAIALDPNDHKAFFNRGAAQNRAQQYAVAIADFDKAIALKSDYEDAYVFRGLAYSNLRQYDRAIQDYVQAIKLKPDDTDAYNDRGVAYDGLHQYDKAIQDYTQVIALQADNALAYRNRGIAYRNLNLPDRAIQDFTKSIVLKSDYVTYYNRGLAYGNMRQYDLAIQDYTQALALKPDDVDSLNDRGRVYRVMKQNVLALADLDKAISLNPNYALAYYNRGVIYKGLKQTDRALQEFNQAIKINPDYYYFYTARGGTYLQAKQFALAVADENSVLNHDPKDVEAFYYRGAAEFELGQFKSTIEDCDKLIALDPVSAQAYLLRGNAKSRTGNTVEGNRDIEKAVKLDPSLGK